MWQTFLHKLSDLFKKLFKMSDAKSFNSGDTIDKIIFAGELQMFSNGGSGVYATGISQFAYPVGIFSTDGGITWSDCSGWGFFTNVGVGARIMTTIRVDSNGMVTCNANAYNGASTSLTVIVRFALIALDNPTAGIVNPVSGVTPTSYSNVSDGSYREIALSGKVTGFDSGSTSTIAHGRNGLPTAINFAAGFLNNNVVPFSGFISFQSGIVRDGYCVYYDNTNIYARSGVGSYNIWYYRVYKED